MSLLTNDRYAALRLASFAARSASDSTAFGDVLLVLDAAAANSLASAYT